MNIGQLPKALRLPRNLYLMRMCCAYNVWKKQMHGRQNVSGRMNSCRAKRFDQEKALFRQPTWCKALMFLLVYPLNHNFEF